MPRTRFVAEAHIPAGSADAVYRIVEVNSIIVVAIIDPGQYLDDPRVVAERIADLMNLDPDAVF